MIPTSRHKTTLLLLLAVSLLCLVLLTGTAPKGATAVSPSHVPPEGWVVECVDCLHYFTGMSGSSAALDSDGFVHTAYGGDGLYYATQNPDDTFQIEIVDDNPYRGVNASMVLDSSDHPHILYYAADLLRLNYAHFDGSQWQLATLPTADLTMPPNPWLVIDSSDFLHMVYNENDSDVVYGRYNLNTWDFTVADTADTVPIGHPSIALDSSSLPHITYASGQKYAYLDGLNWQITTFTESFEYGENVAIAIDQNDSPHIAFQADVDTYWGYDMVYRYQENMIWQWELIEENAVKYMDDHLGDGISLVIDAANQPAVTYSGYFEQLPYPWFYHHDLHFAQKNTYGWQITPRFNLSYTLYDTNYSTLMKGPGNKLTIVTKDGPDMKLIVMDGDDKFYYYIDRGGSTGTHHDMEVDNEDRLHIAIHEAELDHLRYGLKENGSWTLQTLGYNTGFLSSDWKSLALTTDGLPYIMFDMYDRFGALRIAYFDGQDWIFEVNPYEYDTVYDVGVDRNNQLHVAFYASYNVKKLKYSVRDSSGTWSESVVVDPDMTDGMLDMALDSADFPHISYPSENGLGYAVQTPSGWITTTIAGGVISDTTIALDKNDHPHIAWYDKNAQDLKYAAFDGDDWHFAAVDTEGDVGRYADLAVDNLGRVYIAYYDATNQDLKYAVFDGAAWTITTLVSEGDVGSYSSLAMPFAGYPAIAYYDAVTHDLMLVYRPFQPNNFTYLPLLPAK
jgi:hypothetical protein